MIIFGIVYLIISVVRTIHNFSLMKAMKKEWKGYSIKFKSRKSALKKKKRRMIAILISIIILIGLGYVLFVTLKLYMRDSSKLIILMYSIYIILIGSGMFAIIKYLDDKDEMLEDHATLLNDDNAFYLISKYGVKAYVLSKITRIPRRNFSDRNFYLVARINIEDSTIINRLSIREDIKNYETLGDCSVNIYKENDYLIIECYMYNNFYIRRNSKKAWYIEEKTIELFEKVLNQLDNY